MSAHSILDTLKNISRMIGLGGRKRGGMRGLTFVTVVYDDWHGLRHPIGIVHEVKLADGQKREIFTFCGKSAHQPGMALFVEKRVGNLASGLVLSHEEAERIPSFLKKLPNAYKEAHFAGMSVETMALAS